MARIYEVDFEHEDGFVTTSTVAGNSRKDAREFAERCAKRGYSVRSVRARRPACHYCGMPAVGRGFFGEPVCSECGG